MMEFLAVVVLLIVAALVAAFASGSPGAWFRAEWRRMCAETFEPPLSDVPQRPCTIAYDTRCQNLAIRQRQCRAMMKRKGIRLLDEDREAWQKPIPHEPRAPAPTTNIRRIK